MIYLYFYFHCFCRCCSAPQSCPTLCHLWTAACQTSLSFTISQTLLKLMSIESVMSSNHLILCHHPAFSSSLLLQPSVFPSISVFSNTGVSVTASVLPMNTQDSSPFRETGWISLQSKGLSRVFSTTTVQKHQFFGTHPSLRPNSHIHT